jgi:hypothetical protein
MAILIKVPDSHALHIIVRRARRCFLAERRVPLFQRSKAFLTIPSDDLRARDFHAFLAEDFLEAEQEIRVADVRGRPVHHA